MEKILNPAGRVSLLSFFGSKEVKCNWDFISTNSITVYGSLGSPGVWPFVIAKLENGDIEVNSIISHRTADGQLGGQRRHRE
jgi:threonine dehydrogenase-like Zn-dependent dehydrogenase